MGKVLSLEEVDEETEGGGEGGVSVGSSNCIITGSFSKERKRLGCESNIHFFPYKR